MSEPVRVRDNVTRHEYSTYGVYDGMTVLEDEPAVDGHGELIPPKYPETPATAAPAPAKATGSTTTGRKATTEEH